MDINIYMLTGVWCTWRTMAIINGVMSVLCLLVLIPLPESPLWLLTFSKFGEIPTDQISKSLRWIYRNEMVILILENNKLSDVIFLGIATFLFIF